jgi:hypothetical protein
MYDLPDDFDPSCFVGGYLSLISFGVGTIHLNLELSAARMPGALTRASITSNSTVRLITSAREWPIRIGEYAEIARLGILLNENITNAAKIGPRSIRVEFGEAGAVQFDDDGSGYECYQLSVPGSDMIVV